AEALGVCPALEPVARMPGAVFISNEPSITIAVDEECRTQCRVHIESRTTPFHIRSGEYPEDQLSVYVTACRYGSLDAGKTYVEVLSDLQALCCETIDNYVVDSVLQPLARTIALD
ncbi:MAG: hypothetical protein AAF790_09530, partial [Planctomycetota bacterium]